MDNIAPKNFDLTIIGSGYVGLVAACCFAKFKRKTYCVDIDQEKIDKLKQKICPFYEPGLKEILTQAIDEKTIEFTTDIKTAIEESNIIFVAVNTPTQENGDADLTAVKVVAKIIAKYINNYKIICIKSTVPIGTYKIIDEIIKLENTKAKFDIVSLPEFLREGSAINDFINPNRIVIGARSKEVFEKVKSLFENVNIKPENIIFTNNLVAETIKYVANSFLALKISFTNEISNFCDRLNIDAFAVMNAVGKDERIGSEFLNPGPGFGGSCFPKDVKALKKKIEDVGIEPRLITNILKVNDAQKNLVVKRLCNLLNNNLKNKNIAVLGLAFKANTDDIRESSALTIIKELILLGANIKAYDPQANNNMKLQIPDITYFENIYLAVTDCDAILVLTEWQEFNNLDFDIIKNIVKQKIILDTRNIVNHTKALEYGFLYDGIGKKFLLHI